MEQSIIKHYSGTPFSVECSSVKNAPGTWPSTQVNIFRDGVFMGQYIRNYSNFGPQTFYPFFIGTQWYALYSANYTATRVMRFNQNDLEDWCGEEPNSNGFCPTEFYVPKFNHNRYSYGDSGEYINSYTVDCDIEDKEFIEEQKIPTFLNVQYCNFGFMSGCVWGDDTSWKLRYIDLSKIPDKIFTITEKFGYWELPEDTLKKCIRMDGWEPDHQYVRIYKAEFIRLDNE